MKKILITGGSGFIGRNLVEFYDGRSQYEIFAPSHQELDLFESDAALTYIEMHGITHIVNCANIGGGRDTIGLVGTVEKNLRIFFNLVRAASRSQKIIHLGSGAEYDKRRTLINVSERAFDSHVPVDEYGYAKYLCSKYILSAQKPSMVVLRLFGVFGKYENYLFRFISNSIVKNLLGMPITIVQNAKFDYLSVDDLSVVIEYFIEHPSSERAYNVTSGTAIDLVSIAGIINQIADVPSSIKIIHNGFNNEYSGDNSLLKNEIPGLAFTSIAASIRDLFLYYKEILPKLNIDSIRKDAFLQHCTVR